MAFFKKVSSGEKVRHSALKENSVSDLLNRFPGTGDMGNKPFLPGQVYLAVKNMTTGTIPGGTPVAVESGAIPADMPLIPAVKKAQSDDCYGILAAELKPGYSGYAIFAGIVEIALAKALPDDAYYVEPNGSGGFVAADSGRAEVLWSDSTRAILLLGGSGGTAYSGPFAVTAADGKLTVSDGYLNRNGEFLAMPETKGVAAATGTLCLCTTIDKNGLWTRPEIKIAEPAADAYPLAEITVLPKTEHDDNPGVAVRQFPVTVAIIALAKPCPLAQF